MYSAHRGECGFSTGGLYMPTHLCLAHFELHKKKSSQFFALVLVRLGGGVLESEGGGWSSFRR